MSLFCMARFVLFYYSFVSSSNRDVCSESWTTVIKKTVSRRVLLDPDHCQPFFCHTNLEAFCPVRPWSNYSILQLVLYVRAESKGLNTSFFLSCERPLFGWRFCELFHRSRSCRETQLFSLWSQHDHVINNATSLSQLEKTSLTEYLIPTYFHKYLFDVFIFDEHDIGLVPMFPPAEHVIKKSPIHHWKIQGATVIDQVPSHYDCWNIFWTRHSLLRSRSLCPYQSPLTACSLERHIPSPLLL